MLLFYNLDKSVQDDTCLHIEKNIFTLAYNAMTLG